MLDGALVLRPVLGFVSVFGLVLLCYGRLDLGGLLVLDGEFGLGGRLVLGGRHGRGRGDEGGTGCLAGYFAQGLGGGGVRAPFPGAGGG